MARGQAEETISVSPIIPESVTVGILGTSPLVMNRMSEKARMQLLMPTGPKTAADKRSSLKHVPIDEYRGSVYRLTDGPTVLAMPTTAVKGTLMTAALDTGGVARTQIGRLVYVVGDYLPVWGVPKLLMSITRSADIARTPDVRTRAILPHWCMFATIRYVPPLLNRTTIVNLLSRAGLTAGVGDWRQEKGKGSYGQFDVVSAEDERMIMIMESEGRIAQEAALQEPDCYDSETADLFAWYTAEVIKRGKK
jgi:hypothetical protein